MSKYIRVTMVFESKIIEVDSRGFAKSIHKTLIKLYDSDMVIEPNAMTIEVLDTEDDDATV